MATSGCVSFGIISYEIKSEQTEGKRKSIDWINKRNSILLQCKGLKELK